MSLKRENVEKTRKVILNDTRKTKMKIKEIAKIITTYTKTN